jgi:hypothetical protein
MQWTPTRENREDQQWQGALQRVRSCRHT